MEIDISIDRRVTGNLDYGSLTQYTNHKECEQEVVFIRSYYSYFTNLK